MLEIQEFNTTIDDMVVNLINMMRKLVTLKMDKLSANDLPKNCRRQI